MTDPAFESASARRLSAPVARISLSALERNARLLVRAATGETIADLRRDARGHGAPEVARVLLSAGVGHVLVDAGVEIDVDHDTARTSGEPTLDSDALFGLNPEVATTPVLSLHGAVISTKALRRGEAVSYGYTFRADIDTRIALITGGYAQGIARSLGNEVDVMIGESRHPIVGRVAMDVCVVDIGTHATVEAGDDVIFFGADESQPQLFEWARVTGLTAAELAAAIGLRATREYVR